MKNKADDGALPINTEPTPEYNDENNLTLLKLFFSWRRVFIVSIGYKIKSTEQPASEPAF